MTNAKPSSPGRYDRYPTKFLLEAFRLASEKIDTAISGLSEKELKNRIIPGKWSIFEIIIHLTDGEIIGATRIRQILTGHPGQIPFYLEAEWADKLDYQNRTMEFLKNNLSLFTLLRKTSFEYLAKCEDHDWNKEGVHPVRGVLTLRQILELYADHGERHLEQILDRRLVLKRPIDVAIHLTERL